MIDQRDFAIVETVVEMYLNKSYPVLAEDKEAVSEGESGGSSEDHQDRLHHHHQHFPAHPGLRGEDTIIFFLLSYLHVSLDARMLIFVLKDSI